MVDRRVSSVDDGGDTAGVRINFGVLYGNMPVGVTTKGVSPEWLYEQLIVLQ